MSYFIARLQYYIKNSFSGQCCFPTVAHAFDIPINTQRICRSRSYGIEEIIEDMRILLGVPKYRTSKPKKTTRKYSYTRLLTHNANLVNCHVCGLDYEIGTLCGNCYQKVRQLTNEIKFKMMNYNPYKGERQDKEVHVQFRNDIVENGVLNGKRILEMDKDRPGWFKKLVKQ